MSAQLTIVVPLRVGAGKGESDLDRFERLLWPSFQRLWQGAEQLSWLIVCPPGERGLVRARLDALGAQHAHVVSDDELAPGLAGLKGWHKQQVLKLAAAQRVETSHYLTLDADVVLLRPASTAALLPGGRPLLGDRRGLDHPDWWAASARVLHTELRVRPDDLVMGVTPAILATQLARRVLDEVARRNGVEDAARLLFDRRREGWTEYTLYWTLALETGAAASYRADGRPLYMGLFDPEHRDRLDSGWLAAEYGRTDGPFFLVVQSTFGFDIHLVARAVRPWVELPAARWDGQRQVASTRRRMERLGATARAWWYRRFQARRVRIDQPRGLVTFTFDDFPASAMNGARLLEERGWRGTFYVATGLMGQPWHGERVCTEAEVAELAARGHEIGNHTASHLRCVGRSQELLERECATSRALLDRYDGNRSFAFPHGAFDHDALAFFGRRFMTVRTVEYGVNRGQVDFNRLNGVAVRREQAFERLERLVSDVERHGGWLIFYCHDVRPEPSPYGCTEQRLEQLLDCVARAGLEVVTMADGAERIQRPVTAPAASSRRMSPA